MLNIYIYIYMLHIYLLNIFVYVNMNIMSIYMLLACGAGIRYCVRYQPYGTGQLHQVQLSFLMAGQQVNSKDL